jgi:hypothetical protein
VPVIPATIGYKAVPYVGSPSPYVGVAPAAALALAGPALKGMAGPIIAGAIGEIQDLLPDILAKIKEEIAGIASPCKQAIEGWNKEWHASAAPLLKQAQQATDPVLKYSYAAAIVEMGSSYPWDKRFAGKAVINPPVGKPRACGWASGPSQRNIYTIPAGAIMSAHAAAANLQAERGERPQAGGLGALGVPPWALGAGAVALLFLIARR